MILQARTALDTPILSKTLHDVAKAIEWAETEGQRYGAARIVRKCGDRWRTVWRLEDQSRMAALGSSVEIRVVRAVRRAA